MSGPTKAELEERLQSAVSQVDGAMTTAKSWKDKLDKLDPEALALAECVAALEKYGKTKASYGATHTSPNSQVVERILLHLSSRYGCAL